MEDRGDGLFLLVASSVAKSTVIGRWVAEVHQALRQHNHLLRDPVRLRIGMHAGEVHQDDHGVVGTDLNTAFRLASSEPARAAMVTDAKASVVLAVSDLLYLSVAQ